MSKHTAFIIPFTNIDDKFYAALANSAVAPKPRARRRPETKHVAFV